MHGGRAHAGRAQGHGSLLLRLPPPTSVSGNSGGNLELPQPSTQNLRAPAEPLAWVWERGRSSEDPAWLLLLLFLPLISVPCWSAGVPLVPGGTFHSAGAGPSAEAPPLPAGPPAPSATWLGCGAASSGGAVGGNEAESSGPQRQALNHRPLAQAALSIPRMINCSLSAGRKRAP